MLRKQVVSCFALCSKSSRAWLCASSNLVDRNDGSIAQGLGSAPQRCSEPVMEPSTALDPRLQIEQRESRLPWLQGLARHRNSAMGFHASSSLASLPLCPGPVLGAMSWAPGSVGHMAGMPLSPLPMPGAWERSITTKTWRRLKIKKHKIRKRRRLNRKAAK